MTADTLTLAGFLLARIAEREKPCVCNERWNGACGGPWCREDCRVCSDGDAYTEDELVLAECEAKRRIVEMGQFSDSPESAVDFWLEEGKGMTPPQPLGTLVDVFRALALPYADHADYDETWRP